MVQDKMFPVHHLYILDGIELFDWSISYTLKYSKRGKQIKHGMEWRLGYPLFYNFSDLFWMV
jgi:hypothetical protein